MRRVAAEVRRRIRSGAKKPTSYLGDCETHLPPARLSAKPSASQPGSNQKNKTLLLRVAPLALVAASLTACISSRETLCRETERVKVEFENDTAAPVF